MALTVTHSFVSPVVDDSVPGEVGPGEWNATHTVTGNDAASVSVVPVGNVAATNVQAAIAELDSEKAAVGHTHSAVLVTFSPVGNVASGDVQSAISELDNEKVAKAGDTMTGRLNVNYATGQSITSAAVAGQLQLSSNVVGAGFAGLTFFETGNYAVNVGVDTAVDTALRIGGGNLGATSHRVVHEGLDPINLGTVNTSYCNASYFGGSYMNLGGNIACNGSLGCGAGIGASGSSWFGAANIYMTPKVNVAHAVHSWPVGYPNSVDGGVKLRLDSGNVTLDFGANHDGATWSNWIQSRDASNFTSYRIVLNPNGGEVGIGTTTPTTGYALTINGATHATGHIALPSNPEPYHATRRDYVDYLHNTQQPSIDAKVNRAGDTMSGRLQLAFASGALTSGGTGQMELQSNINNAVGSRFAGFALHIGGYYATQVGIDPDAGDANLRIGGWSMGAVSYRILHEGLQTWEFKQLNARIMGDMSGTFGQRLSFMNSVANGNSILQVMPNGSSTVSAVRCLGSSNPDGVACGIGSMQFGTPIVNALTLATQGLNGAATPEITFYPGVDAGRFTTAGYLLCGYAASNGAYRLQVNGQIFSTYGGIVVSDLQYKKNITELMGGLAFINDVQPIEFDWRKHPVHNFPEGRHVGFIAQDVQTALGTHGYRDSVTQAGEIELPDGGKEEFVGMSQTSMIPFLVSAVKELSAKVTALEVQLAALT